MQVKLGRTRSPETLIGTENIIDNDNDMTEKPRDYCGQDDIRSAKENKSFGINKEQNFEQNGDMKHEGRRSMNDSRRSFYDYSDIYSVSMNKDGNMNPEVALDNIQINGMNENQYFDGQQSITSVEAPENEDEYS